MGSEKVARARIDKKVVENHCVTHEFEFLHHVATLKVLHGCSELVVHGLELRDRYGLVRDECLELIRHLHRQTHVNKLKLHTKKVASTPKIAQQGSAVTPQPHYCADNPPQMRIGWQLQDQNRPEG